MHILTGFLLAGLLGKNKFRRRTLMPMLRTGPVQTAHFVPGRVRLRVPSLAENSAGAALVREKLPTIEGVQSVKLNPATGSVLDCLPRRRSAARVALRRRRPPDESGRRVETDARSRSSLGN